MLTVFWDMKGLITIDFFEKGATGNNTLNCQLLRKNLSYLLNDPHIYSQFGRKTVGFMPFAWALV